MTENRPTRRPTKATKAPAPPAHAPYRFGYARVSKADGQSLDLQTDAFHAAGIRDEHIFVDRMSGARENRPGLDACLKALRPGDTLVVWRLDRLGRSLRQLVDIVAFLEAEGIAFKVLEGHGAAIDTTRPDGRLMFSIFAAFAEFERELIRERTNAGLKSARARGRIGGRQAKMTPAMIKTAAKALEDTSTNITELAKILGVHRSTVYRCVNANGTLTEFGKKIINSKT